jgi:type IV pilus assembly protein PilB
MAGKLLGELLVDAGLLTADRLQQALMEQKRSGSRLGEWLLHKGWITEDQLYTALEQQLGIQRVRLYRYTVEPSVLDYVPEEYARKRHVLPLERQNGTLTVAMSDPTDYYAQEELRLRTGLQIQPVIASRDELERAIRHFYSTQPPAAAAVEGRGAPEEEADPTTVSDADSSAVARLVQEVLTFAVRQHASDVHVEPQPEGVRVRMRIDGVLHTERMLPRTMLGVVTARLKLIAGLNVAERRLPQDGRIRIKVDGRDIDFRVSTLPLAAGEKAVMRVLDPGSGVRSLEELSLSPANLRLMERAMAERHGLVLVTGPTGSGKTSTLYAALAKVSSVAVNIVTLEDPIEYQLAGVNQLQVNPAIGLTFAQGLRAVLRQDPDIVMVGEIRDGETASMAVRAALTGHLVLSTLHTNGAVSTINRLTDMGVDRFLVAPALRTVVAQRLVRRLCEFCSREEEPDQTERAELSRWGIATQSVRHAVGCPVCFQTGYKGRMALHEILPVSEEVRRMVIRGESEAELMTCIRRRGFRTMLEDGLEKVAAGWTTLSEVLRECPPDGDAL